MDVKYTPTDRIGFWRACWEMDETRQNLRDCCRCIGITLAVIMVILATQVLPTMSIILVWKFDINNRSWFDSNPNVGDAFFLLMIFNLMQIAAVVAVVIAVAAIALAIIVIFVIIWAIGIIIFVVYTWCDEWIQKVRDYQCERNDNAVFVEIPSGAIVTSGDPAEDL